MAPFKLHVFIVDDDDSFRFITKKLCKMHPSIGTIDEFNDTMGALRHLMKHKKNPVNLPDIILLDLSFPTLSGWDFLESLEEMYYLFTKKILVYVVSSASSEKDIAKAKSCSLVNGIIAKPITLDHINRIIANQG